MESTENIRERIQHIISKKGLTPSKFADTIGVQRSGISHILSGRNKPGLELLNKILTSFPDVNAGWLITGKGEAFGMKEKVSSAPADELFPGDEIKSDGKEGEKNINHEEDPPEYAVRRKAENKLGSHLKLSSKEEKEIEKIVIFYTDRTFREYSGE